MPSPFTVDRHRWASLDDPGLRDQLQRHTGSDDAVESILRSLARFGTDPSIGTFLVSPRAGRAPSRVARAVVWTVHANRA